MSNPSGPRREAPGVLLCTLIFLGICALVIATNCAVGAAGRVSVHHAEAATAAPWVCTQAPTAVPLPGGAPGEPPSSWVLNTSSRRFHLPDCSSVSTIREQNRADFTGTREALIEMGYKPCGSCNP